MGNILIYQNNRNEDSIEESKGQAALASRIVDLDARSGEKLVRLAGFEPAT